MTIRTLAFSSILTGLALAGTLASANAASDTQWVASAETYGYAKPYMDSMATAPADVAHYDHSGSRGRLPLGASPKHPEGPGNFSD